ncbi:MAG: polysaccharide deacetylase family protein, partial [Steroidobacteraceae bacterium]
GYANNLRLAARILKERRLPATVFISTGFIGDGRMWNDTVIESLRRADGVLDLCDLALGRFVLDGQMARRRAIETILGALKYLPGAERLARACVIAERVGEDLPGDLMMTEAEIRQIQSLDVEIGAHTVSHPILKSLDADTARHEIAASKHVLEAIARAPVTAFAYPNGRPGRDYDASHVKMVRQTGFTAAVSTSWGAADRRSDRLQVPRMLPWEKSALGFAVRLLRARLGPRAETA